MSHAWLYPRIETRHGHGLGQPLGWVTEFAPMVIHMIETSQYIGPMFQNVVIVSTRRHADDKKSVYRRI